MSTLLADRVLWYDGTSQVDPEKVPSLIYDGVPLSKISVNAPNRDVQLFNMMEKPLPIGGPRTTPTFDLSWNIPEQWKNIDLADYILAELEKRELSSAYYDRVASEIEYILAHPTVEMLFKTLLYVMDTLRSDDKNVYGIGRGSSCASLILHLMGVHAVDPVKYDIPMEEFFHD